MPLVSTLVNTMTAYDVLDIIATSVLIYYVLLLIRGTRAVQILTGVLVLVALLGLAKLMQLYLLGTILQLLVLGAKWPRHVQRHACQPAQPAALHRGQKVATGLRIGGVGKRRMLRPCTPGGFVFEPGRPCTPLFDAQVDHAFVPA